MSIMEGLVLNEKGYEGWVRFPFSKNNIEVSTDGVIHGQAIALGVCLNYENIETYEDVVVSVTAVPTITFVPWSEFNKGGAAS